MHLRPQIPCYHTHSPAPRICSRLRAIPSESAGLGRHVHRALRDYRPAVPQENRFALQGPPEKNIDTLPDALVRVPKTGRELWKSKRYAPHRDANGIIIGVIGMMRDMTERKRAEDDLRRALAEVEQLKNQLQEENAYLRRELIVNVSHDLRAPFIRTAGADERRVLGWVARVKRCLRRAQRMGTEVPQV